MATQELFSRHDPRRMLALALDPAGRTSPSGRTVAIQIGRLDRRRAGLARTGIAAVAASPRHLRRGRMALRPVAPARTSRLARPIGRSLPRGSFACDPERVRRPQYATRCTCSAKTSVPSIPSHRKARSTFGSAATIFRLGGARALQPPNTKLTCEAQTTRVIIRFWLRMAILLLVRGIQQHPLRSNPDFVALDVHRAQRGAGNAEARRTARVRSSTTGTKRSLTRPLLPVHRIRRITYRVETLSPYAAPMRSPAPAQSNSYPLPTIFAGMRQAISVCSSALTFTSRTAESMIRRQAGSQ